MNKLTGFVAGLGLFLAGVSSVTDNLVGFSVCLVLSILTCLRIENN